MKRAAAVLDLLKRGATAAGLALAVALLYAVLAPALGAWSVVPVALLLTPVVARWLSALRRARAAEERLVLAVEGTGIGVFDLDLTTGRAYASPSLARLVGLPVSREPQPLAEWLAALPPERVAESRAVLVQKFRERARSYERELAFTASDGRRLGLLLRVDIAWDGERAVRLRGACVDITERKAAAAELEAARAALSQQLDDLHRQHDLSSRLLETGDLNAQLRMILATLLELHGAPRGLLSLMDPEGAVLTLEASVGFNAEAQQRLATVRSGEGPCWLTVAQGRRTVIADTETDPRFAPWRDFARAQGFRAVHGTPLVGLSGRVLGAICVHFAEPREPTAREEALADICARKAAVFTERYRSEQRLKEADRRKDEFLATLAHELRNPLAPIRQAAMLSREPQASAEQKAWAHEVIDRQVRHMALLLDDLLDVSRITRGVLVLRKQLTGLKAVIDAGVETAWPLIEARRHRFELSLPPVDPRIEVDALRLSQVVANLLTNAAKYTDPGGRIGLTATIGPGGDGDGRELCIEVVDNGVGIAPEALRSVFTMFTQLRPAGDRPGGGLGIGLALTKGLVELHGGRIEVHSQPGEPGSRFTVRLPVGAAEAPATVDGPAAQAGAPRGLRVLIADDNRDAAQSLSWLLQLQGHDTRLAFDGDEALAAYDAFAPDVCLLDIGMPRRTGNQVAQQIRSRDGGERPLLVAITGWGQAHDRADAREAGFDDHLTKPVDVERLNQLIAGGRAGAQLAAVDDRAS